MAHAFTPIVRGIYADGWFTIGRADRDVAGYTPVDVTFHTYREAQDEARRRNEELGLTPAEASAIILSTFTPPESEEAD